MTKYSRITGKVFGASANATLADPEIAQFGSGKAGTYNGTSDVAIIQSLSAWQNGFIDCVTPSTQFPPLPEMTGFGKVLSYQLCYLLQQGVAEYDSGTTYYEGNWISYNKGLYVAKQDNFTNQAPTNTAYWEKFTGSNSRNFGEYVTSSLPLTDTTLHLADGSLLSSANYPEFVSHISNLYYDNVQVRNLYCYRATNNVDNIYTLSRFPSVSDFVYDATGGKIGYITDVMNGKIFAYVYTDGQISAYERRNNLDTTANMTTVNYLVPESEWQVNYTVFGESGKYVYNSSTNTVRIPLVNSYFTNTVNSRKLGDLTEASLPNIKGSFNHETADGVATGAFAIGTQVPGRSSDPGGSTDHYIDFNASWYNPIYKDSVTTVNTQSIKQLVYIVVKK